MYDCVELKLSPPCPKACGALSIGLGLWLQKGGILSLNTTAVLESICYLTATGAKGSDGSKECHGEG